MWYLMTSLWLFVLLALLLGLFVGWRSACVDKPCEQAGTGGWWLAALAALVALLVAVIQWVPARLGLWLDTGLILLGVYLLGCAFGCLFRNRCRKQSETIAAPAEAPAAGNTTGTTTPVAASTPAQLASVQGEENHEGARPVGYVSPIGGKSDDLKRIRGIGPQNESRLHALGIWHFSQIAAWTVDEVKWVGSYLAFPGRIDREEWLAQAKVLAEGGVTAFAQRVDRGEVETSKSTGDTPQVASLMDGGFHEGRKPAGLAAPRGGVGDDLTLLNGVGEAIAGKLNGFGIWHFDQLAAMGEDELKWLSSAVGFPGRALRENWAADARTLAAGGETAHSAAVKATRTKPTN